jgi:hypothetical protein
MSPCRLPGKHQVRITSILLPLAWRAGLREQLTAHTVSEWEREFNAERYQAARELTP